VKELLAILNRYKAVFIILTLLLLALLIWMIIIGADNDKIPSRGVFVIGRFHQAVHPLLLP
jgi:hypothetical protein